MTAAMSRHRTTDRTDHLAGPLTGPLTGPGTVRLTGRTGFEIELLAPPGGSRADLAEGLARGCGGTVRRFFHTDSEPSLVPGMDHFIHLTPGFAVVGPDGEERCRLVDDITIRFDLDPAAPVASAAPTVTTSRTTARVHANSASSGASKSASAGNRSAQCNPPYVFGSDGVKTFKPQCFAH